MVSVSDLTSYLYCPRKLYLQKVLKLVEIPREALVLGSIKHAFYEIANNCEQEIVSGIEAGASFEAVLSRYTNTYTSHLHRLLTKYSGLCRTAKLPISEASGQLQSCIIFEANARAKNAFEFLKSSGLSGSALWDALTPKLKSEYSIFSKEIDLSGKIDRIEVHSSFVVPVELKTGIAPEEGVWENHRVQIAAYALLLEKKFNIPSQKGFVTYVDANKTREITINPFMKEEVFSLIGKVKELLASKTPPEPCKNIKKCRNCGLKNHCFNDSRIEKTKDLNTT